MLVDVRKSVEDVERIAGGIVWPSDVRLQPLNFCLRGTRNVLNSPLRAGEHPAILGNRKLHSFRDGLGQGVPVHGDNKHVDEAVKGTAEVVQALSDEEAKIVGWGPRALTQRRSSDPPGRIPR
jgi:hypothetical protein